MLLKSHTWNSKLDIVCKYLVLFEPEIKSTSDMELSLMRVSLAVRARGRNLLHWGLYELFWLLILASPLGQVRFKTLKSILPKGIARTR